AIVRGCHTAQNRRTPVDELAVSARTSPSVGRNREDRCPINPRDSIFDLGEPTRVDRVWTCRPTSIIHRAAGIPHLQLLESSRLAGRSNRCDVKMTGARTLVLCPTRTGYSSFPRRTTNIHTALL